MGALVTLETRLKVPIMAVFGIFRSLCKIANIYDIDLTFQGYYISDESRQQFSGFRTSL